MIIVFMLLYCANEGMDATGPTAVFIVDIYNNYKAIELQRAQIDSDQGIT